MALIGRILVALLILGALPVHGLVPAVKIAQFTNPYVYSLLSGADPLVTAYVDAGWLATLCLLAATVCLIGALVGVLKGERWAASLVLLAAIADGLSLYLAETMGLTSLGLSWWTIVQLGAAMLLLFVLVRLVTRPA